MLGCKHQARRKTDKGAVRAEGVHLVARVVKAAPTEAPEAVVARQEQRVGVV